MASLDRDLGSPENIPVLDDSKGNGQTIFLQMQNKRTSEEFSEVLCVLVSIFLVKIDLNLDKGFGFA